MTPDEPSKTRKHGVHLRVPCLPEEADQIRANAAQTGLAVASFLRKLGLGYRVRGIVDHKQVEELARINGDLGRVGGLLKLWLTDDLKKAQINEFSIRETLKRVEDTQSMMQRVMLKVVQPSALKGGGGE